MKGFKGGCDLKLEHIFIQNDASMISTTQGSLRAPDKRCVSPRLRF